MINCYISVAKSGFIINAFYMFLIYFEFNLKKIVIIVINQTTCDKNFKQLAYYN